MKKALVVFALALFFAAAYAHNKSWTDQSNKIKAHIEQLAAEKNEQFRITYDKIESAGYPFKHEVVLTNPCFYSLQADPNFDLQVLEGCLKGEMLLSYDPLKAEKGIFMQTDGELTLKWPGGANGKIDGFVINGKVTDEFEFDKGYDYAKSGDWVYFLENLTVANLSVKNLTVRSLDSEPKVYFKESDGQLTYSRKPQNEGVQKIQLLIDYSAQFVDSLQNYQPPFDQFFTNLDDKIKDFNKNSGINKGRYDIHATLPEWQNLRQSIDKFTRSYSFDDIPDFTLDIAQTAKNNFYSNKANLNSYWKNGKDSSYVFKFNNKANQDVSKEGAEQFSNLLQDLAQEVVRVMILSSTEKNEAVSNALTSLQFDELFKGMPRHLDLDLNIDVKKSQEEGKEKIVILIDPLMVDTDKGGITLNVDFNSDKPFTASVEFASLVRIVDGLITRYNILAKNIEQGTRIPFINERERDQLLEILQKYSDSPEKLSKNVKFSITQEDQQAVIGKQKHNIYGLIGELGFFFHHLQQKMAPVEAPKLKPVEVAPVNP